MKSFLVGALCAFPLVGLGYAVIHDVMLSWSSFRWLLLLPVCGLHWWGCNYSIVQSLKNKQDDYSKDLKENHATLGHLINVKYAKYAIHREKDLRVSAVVYWSGLLCIALVFWVLWSLPDTF